MRTMVRVRVGPMYAYHRFGPAYFGRGLTGLLAGWLWLSLSMCWWMLLLCWRLLWGAAVLCWTAGRWLWTTVSPWASDYLASKKAEAAKSSEELAPEPPTVPGAWLAPESAPQATLVPPK